MSAAVEPTPGNWVQAPACDLVSARLCGYVMKTVAASACGRVHTCRWGRSLCDRVHTSRILALFRRSVERVPVPEASQIQCRAKSTVVLLIVEDEDLAALKCHRTAHMHRVGDRIGAGGRRILLKARRRVGIGTQRSRRGHARRPMPR